MIQLFNQSFLLRWRNTSRSCLVVLCLIPSNLFSETRPIQGVASEKARQAVAGKIQLHAAELIDQLIYNWSQKPPLGASQRIALVGFSLPIGIRGKIQVFLENRLYSLLLSNPKTGLVPVHCQACIAMTTKSTPKGTVVAPGYLFSEVKKRINTQYALNINIESEGSSLVLRAHITDIASDRLVASYAVETNSSKAPFLRSEHPLISIHEAKNQYLDILNGRPRYRIPGEISTMIFADNPESPTMVPMVFLRTGLDMEFPHSNHWIGGFRIGAASLPQTYDAYSIGGKFSRRIGRFSFHEPMYHLTVGFHHISMRGPQASMFVQEDKFTMDQIYGKILEEEVEPKATLSTAQIGLNLTLGQFFNLGVEGNIFTNHLENKNLGTYWDVFHSYSIIFGFAI